MHQKVGENQYLLSSIQGNDKNKNHEEKTVLCESEAQICFLLVKKRG